MRGCLLREACSFSFGRSRALPRGAVLTAIVLVIAPPEFELAQGNMAAAFECTGSKRRAASLACAMRTASCHSNGRRARSRNKYSRDELSAIPDIK